MEKKLSNCGVWHNSRHTMLRGMKLTLFILLALIFNVEANGFSQQIKVSIECQDKALGEVFKDLEKQTSLYFFFNDKSIDVKRKVTVSLKEQELEKALRTVVGDSYNYEFVNNLIVITHRDETAIPQQVKKVRISGTVVDAQGAPLPGVTILLKGTKLGTATDVDGKFSMEVQPSSNMVLSVSFVGMKTKEVKVTPDKPMKITLESDEQMMDEVVVTGMAKMDKRLFTGATDRLSADDIKLDGIPEVSRALEGRSAGVSVQNVSGTFGSAPKIRVRGATSIYGDSKPLWVVDGVIMEDVVDVSADDLSSGNAETMISSAIAGLNANDIESFQVLKDGSATSIYGARAMAGVIVITTKKGKAGVSHISYTGEFTIRMKPSYNEFNIMNSQEQMGVYQEMKAKGWLNFAETYRASNSGVYGKMYSLLNTYNPATGTFMLENTESARNAYLRRAEMRNTDWFDELFETNVLQNHSVSMSGGSDKSTYYASMSAMVDPGWSKQSKVQRYTMNINTTYNILKNLSLNLIGNGSFRNQTAPGTLSQELDIVSGEVKREFDINPYSYALNTSRVLDPKEFYTRNYAPFNIMHELENNYMDLNVVDLRFQGEMKWKIIPELEVGVMGALKYSSSALEHHIKDESNQALAYRAMPDATIREKNPFLYKDPDHPYELPISVLPEGGIYEKTDNKMLGYDFRGSVSWNHVFAEDHIVNFYGGMELNNADRQKNWFRGWGRQYTMGDVPYYAYEVFKRGVEENTQYFTVNTTRSRSAAFFGMLTYSYQGRYTINGTARYEGTNKLGRSRSARWLPTWNISGAWNMHEEKFFERLEPALTHFTLRASYSLTGDRGPASVTNSKAVFKSKSLWRPQASSQETAIQLDDLENSELTYEKKHELNIGLDLGFLDDRINFNFDGYKRNNYDLIGAVSTMGVGGQVNKMANVAEMESHGVEFTLSTRTIALPDFKWNTDFIFAYSKNKVTKLATRKRVIDLVTGSGFGREGYAVRSLFSIPFMGLNEAGIPTFRDQDGEITSTGIYFQESNNLDFLKYEGPTDPTINGSFGNTFSYKGFRLNVFMTYSFGNKIRLDPVFSGSYSDLDAMPKEFKNRWMIPGEENITGVPVISSKWQHKENSSLNYAYNAYNYSTARIADGGFIRMKEISLNYDFPQRMISRIGLSALSLKVQGTNLFLIYADSKLNGQDPEFFRSGGVSAPVPKQYTFTLRVGF